ncbi:ATP-binding protein [archaeon]|nr:ATP-binding protein [Nanoarchaeota archaeon]MCG2723530.1 ATP-binding protein [archaeon]
MNVSNFLKSAGYFFLLMRPLSKSEKDALDTILPDLPKDARTTAKKLVKQYKARIARKQMPYSEKITSIRHYSLLEAYGEESKDEIARLNKILIDAAETRITEEFSKNAWQNLQKIFAPHLIGFDDIKKGVLLQIFSKDPVHVLLIGDTGTGKTDILRAAEDISPISAFGLGSGTSNTGLTATVRGKEVRKGILSLADNGMALIDELNLMKTEDRAGLYNAMEKGFITFDKGGNHFKFDARCSVLASANPKGSKFKGTTLKETKAQMPFEPALISRFHLIYLIREQTITQFMKIADSVLAHTDSANKKDAEFLKKYIEKAKSLNVDFNETYNAAIKEFVKKAKESESRLVIEVTPRFVVGLKRMIDASARIEQRSRVEKKDVLRAIEAVSYALSTARI